MTASEIRTSVTQATNEAGLYSDEHELVWLAEFLASKGVDNEELETFLAARVEQELKTWASAAQDRPDHPDPSTLF